MINHNHGQWQYMALPMSDMKITKKGNRYKLGVFQNGSECIMFPNDNEFEKTTTWYTPTEKQIFYLKDYEIISVYKQIDNRNKNTYKNYPLNRKEVVKPNMDGEWKCK